MSSSETPYSFRNTFVDVVERERSQKLKMEVRRSRAGVQPTAATITIYQPDNTKLVDAAAAIPVSSGATYVLTGALLASTLPYGEGYRQEWTLTLTGDESPRIIDREMAVARRALYCACAVEDMEEDYPNLEAKLGAAVSLQGYLDAAWKRILRHLIKSGILTYTVVDPGAYIDATRELALHLATKDAHRKQGNGDNRWSELSKEHKDNYVAAMASANFPVDADQDGRADSTSREQAGVVVHPNVGVGQTRRRRSRRW